MWPFVKSVIFHSDIICIGSNYQTLFAPLADVKQKFCGGSECGEERAGITWSQLFHSAAGQTHKRLPHNLRGGDTHTQSCVSVLGHTVVNRMELMSRKNTQTNFLFFFPPEMNGKTWRWRSCLSWLGSVLLFLLSHWPGGILNGAPHRTNRLG